MEDYDDSDFGYQPFFTKETRDEFTDSPLPSLIKEVVLRVKESFREPNRFQKSTPVSSERIAIPGTKLFTSAGPQRDTLDNFIANNIYPSENPVKKIIALGVTFSSDKHHFPDFADYCFTDGDRSFALAGKNYRFTVTRKSGEAEFKTNRVCPSTIAYSTLSFPQTDNSEAKDVDVVLIPISDGGSLNLANCWHSHPVLDGEVLKKAIWEIYEDSLINNTVIHCSAGRGRTGYFLMSLMLLMNYDTVFASENVADITSEVMKIYKMLREISPLYMLRDNQLGNAVCTSYLAHQYGMELQAKARNEATTQCETTEATPLRRSASFGDMKQNVAILAKMGSVYTAVVPDEEEKNSHTLELK
ncbi:protein-tyrosine phosphatase family protein [Legionella sp. 16cNR16C]|uniref:protein-tyrosine phosphatase family protein n=1 Tax=Legionella sp. 16cNR16C TaxID=2905656 RepID=UPI001E5D45BB|nr:protein-tyrosine phosphatase family protein [Legionella sp. 16cNR16C]MCE3043784.1 hypothetical protein [Legionella sp. 16cNR16C]